MLHSIKDLENWLEKHGKILESKVEILEPNKPRYFISYDFYWNGELVAGFACGQKTYRKCLQTIYNDCIDLILKYIRTGNFWNAWGNTI